MNNWNQHFNTYRVKTQAFPRWVTRLPMAVAILLLVPALLMALVAVLAGLLLFTAMLVVWRLLLVFVPSTANEMGADQPMDDGRINVKVVGRQN